MGVQDIIDAAEAVVEADERRQEDFREEFDAYEEGDLETFPRTREAIATERAALADLAAELDAEEGNIEQLVDHTDFLSVDQAVHHRDESIEKLRAHNEHLREFHDAMSAALETIETNLDLLESEGPEAVEGDPEAEFERARDALEAHNAAVEDLNTNLTILNAYLL